MISTMRRWKPFARPAVPPSERPSHPRLEPVAQGTEEIRRHAHALAGICAQHARGYAYSQFSERYRQSARRLKPSMRQGALPPHDRVVHETGISWVRVVSRRLVNEAIVIVQNRQELGFRSFDLSTCCGPRNTFWIP